VAALGGEFEFKIVTLDRDLGDNSPYPGIQPNKWVRFNETAVIYLSPDLRGFLAMWAQLRSVDQNTVLYLNSFFARRFSMLGILMHWLKLCRPRCIVLAPRGEFSLGALKFKRRRKLLYVKISKWLGVYRSTIWQASTDFEAEDIRRQFHLTEHINIAGIVPGLDWINVPRTSVVVTASDIAGAVSKDSNRRRPKRAGQLRAVFVSRLSRKKNLSGALSMLAGLSGDVLFDIYGPVEDHAYMGECQTLIDALPANICVRCHGEIEHEKVREIFSQSDLFLFPTHGENYGHVIWEALASGCPVLISDQTPWNDLEAEQAGWTIPLNEIERFRSVLQQCVGGDGEWFAKISDAAVTYAMSRAADPETLNANRRLFFGALTLPHSQ
jgi:glycosyltransferase involved in cell wall biosynthesis